MSNKSHENKRESIHILIQSNIKNEFPRKIVELLLFEYLIVKFNMMVETTLIS